MDDSFDLNRLITHTDLATASRCGGGGYGDVYVLEHESLGKLAMKRLREVGSRASVVDQRRASFNED